MSVALDLLRLPVDPAPYVVTANQRTQQKRQEVRQWAVWAPQRGLVWTSLAATPRQAKDRAARTLARRYKPAHPWLPREARLVFVTHLEWDEVAARWMAVYASTTTVVAA